MDLSSLFAPLPVAPVFLMSKPLLNNNNTPSYSSIKSTRDKKHGKKPYQRLSVESLIKEDLKKAEKLLKAPVNCFSKESKLIPRLTPMVASWLSSGNLLGKRLVAKISHRCLDKKLFNVMVAIISKKCVKIDDGKPFMEIITLMNEKGLVRRTIVDGKVIGATKVAANKKVENIETKVRGIFRHDASKITDGTSDVRSSAFPLIVNFCLVEPEKSVEAFEYRADGPTNPPLMVKKILSVKNFTTRKNDFKITCIEYTKWSANDEKRNQVAKSKAEKKNLVGKEEEKKEEEEEKKKKKMDTRNSIRYEITVEVGVAASSTSPLKPPCFLSSTLSTTTSSSSLSATLSTPALSLDIFDEISNSSSSHASQEIKSNSWQTHILVENLLYKCFSVVLNIPPENLVCRISQPKYKLKSKPESLKQGVLNGLVKLAAPLICSQDTLDKISSLEKKLAKSLVSI
jgi:hypothetical protein